MIEAIYRIGKIQPQGDFLEDFIEDIGKNYKNVFEILIDITDIDNFIYKGIEYEEYDSSKKMKFFYKKGSSRGIDRTPTSKITEIEKTLDKKIKPFFKSFIKSNKALLDNNDTEFISKIGNLFDKKFDTIKEDLINFVKANGFVKESDRLSLKEPSIITFCFLKGDKKYYVGDLSIFVNVFKDNENESYKNFYEKDKIISKANNKFCYICKKESREVWGFVNTYNFYTADKESYIAGGFNKKLMWKNYPVCSSCAKILEKGKKYADKNLIYKFCGFDYYIIPELIIDDDYFLEKTLKAMKKYQDFSLEESKSSLIENVEEKILKELSTQNNNINFNFLFFKKQNSAFKILLFIKDIAPTRLRKLIKAKEDVDDHEKKVYDIFKELPTKKSNISLNFSFKFIREFFPNTKRDGKFDKYFLSILNNIFIGEKISLNLLLSRFMEKIRSEFLKDNWIDAWVLKSYKILLYIEKINCLERRKNMVGNIPGNIINSNEEKIFEDFFRENNIFDDPVKKALFLEGVLTKKLLNIQRQQRNSEPFRNRLNGLKIDEKIAKRLLPEIINKLEEYEKNYYHSLEENIGKYLLKSDFKKYSIDEMSYYFTLGLVLAKHFTFSKDNKN